MSTPAEYESKAQQNYGPTASTNVIKPLLESKLAKRTSLNSLDAAVMCSISSLTSDNNPEPDSTQTIDRTMIQTFQTKFDKAHDAISRTDSEYQISNIDEGDCDADVAVGTISGLVKIEEAGLENVARLPYPVIHESHEANDEFITNQSTATLMSSSIDSAIVQNFTKLPQNFTLNVETGLTNIATVQNISQDVSTNQTLWLPTILATSSTSALDGKTIGGDRSQTGVSQIIITSATENYIPHSINNQNVSVKRSNIVTDANASRTKTSKVQILSNITIPKPSNIASIAQFDTSNVKDSVEPTIYGTQSHLYKLSASVTSIPHKHGASNSILNNKVGKTQSLISSSSVLPVVNQVQGKASIAYTSNFQKTSHLNRSMNKVNNGANNASNSLSNVAGQCHIFSRMVPGPKLSVHSGRKNVNSFSSGKNTIKSAVSQSSSAVSSQKSQQQSSKPIKIIQQTTNLQSPNKNEMKSWAITHTNTNITKTFTPVDSASGKTIASQKLSPMQHKGLHGVVSLQKLASTKSEQQRLVLHSSQVIIPNASPQTTTHLKSQPNQQVQRYVQNYIATNNNQLGSVTQISANQHLTAQILQSLSQPKLVLQAGPVIAHQETNPKCNTIYEAESSPPEIVHDQKRQIHGDPSTLLTADDIIGMEERPNINDELLRYPYHDLALVMLDHTYAVCAQSMPSISTGCTVTGSTTLTSSPVSTVASLASGMILASPTLVSGQVPENSTRSPPTSVTSIPTNTPNQNTMVYKPQPVPRPDDDDAGSIISSVDGQDPPRDGSDTETAPEGEEEGKTRCVCEFTHDDGYMICCDRCSEWQHVDCMGIDRQNIPDTYMCDRCQPRPIDRRRARMIQLRKREELSALVPSDSDSSDGVPHTLGPRRRRLLTVTTYSNTSGPKLPQFNQVPPVPVQSTPPIVNKRGPKRPRRTDIARKSTKRKIPEKRVKRKKDFIMNRPSKYNQVANVNQNHCLNDTYESAMTNHYSPELRAKVVRYSSKLGNMPNIASAINAHYCTTVPHAGGKILIATKDLKESMPVIELRGKYMLANQHRPQPQLSSRSGGQKPGPFLFFYRLPKDNTQICIDTRTYGNEARFVRRSCKPNAELQHSIVKGVLHVYIITISAIQSNTEITIGHDTTTSKQPCACGNPKHCNMNGMSNLALRKMHQAEFAREKRTRSRRSSSSSPASPTGQVISPLTPKEQNTRPPFMKQEKKSPVKLENNISNPIKYTEYLNYMSVPEVKSEAIVLKEDVTDPIDGDADTASCDETKMKVEPIEEEELPTPKVVESYNIVKDEEKAILEEVKSSSLFATNEKVLEEDIPKEECEEKPILSNEHIKSEFIKVKEEEKNCQVAVPQAAAVKAASIVSTRTSRTSIVSNSFVHDSLDDKTDDSQDKQISITPSAKDKKKMTREERKMEAIMKAFERMEKAEQRKQEVKERQSKRRESDPVQPTAGSCEKEIDIDEENALQSSAKKRRKRKGRARTTSQNAQSNRRRLNSADSDMMTSGDEAVSQTSPHPPSHLSEPEPMDTPSIPQTLTPELPARVTDGITEDVGLSSACLLVEAAVGPLENAFKLPKTKKSIVSEWLGKSPERTSSTEFNQPLTFSMDSGLPYSAPKPTLLTPRSLESLVQVASTIIGDLSGGTICADSSPEKSYYGGTGDDRFTALTPTDSPQKLTAEEIFQSPEVQSPVRPSLLTPIKRSPRNLQKELVQPPLEKIKTPKKYKRGLRAVIEDRITATRRTLRSTPQSEAEKPQEDGPEAPPQVEMSAANNNVITNSVQTPFQLPQHSAKKRWLRQAISEESDSPTAESPPNEMVTPLKKRRLARESLSCEPSNLNMQFEDVSSIALPPDAPPVKTINVEATAVSPQTYKLNPVTSPHKYDHDDYHPDNAEGTGSNEHSMDCKFDSGGDYLDINLRNRHDAKKFKMDIRRIIGVPGTEENTDVVEEVQDLPCLSSEKQLSTDSTGDDANKFNNTLVDDKAEENNPDTSIELDLTDNKSELVEGQEDTIGEHPLNSKTMIDNIADSKSETHSNANSTETSGNSSPQVDEMDDIQKKIHSFHTENIQILKIRNKKLPKEKRKKVNLNFDLCMLDDQTVSVKLRTDSGQNTPKSPEVNGEVIQEEQDVSPLNVLPINVEDIPVPDYRPDSPPVRGEKGEVQTMIVMEASPSEPAVVDDKPRILQAVEAAIPSDGGLTFSSHFSSGGLFSGLFGSTCHATTIDSSLTLNDNVPNMNIIKSAIDRTTNMENTAFMDRTTLTPVDELRNVQEILSRVNKMDSNNSVLLSGVLKDTEISSKIEVMQPSPVKTFSPKSNDPRLNPPPIEKPKPMRRKLSITEYRKRHNMQSNADSSSAESKIKDSTDQSPRLGTDSNSNSSGSTFRGGGSVSPLRIGDDAMVDDIDSRLERQLEESLHEHSSTIPPDLCSDKKGLFDAQPTQVERQRENLSERLRREFGLSLPEDEEARSATALQDPIQSLDIPLPSEQSSYEQAQAFLRPALPHKLQRFDR